MIKINFITSWAQGIIVSVIIVTIIEMILPNNNNSKYIKIVIGIFILFTIISPIINKISGKKNNINIGSIIDKSTEETIEASSSIDNEALIRQMYEENLKLDIKAKISQKGYVVGNIDVEILNNSEYTLNSISMKIIGNSQNQSKTGNNNQKTTTIVENIEDVLINVSNNSSNKNENENEKSVISESEKRRLIQYLSSVYEVKESNIIII